MAVEIVECSMVSVFRRHFSNNALFFSNLESIRPAVGESAVVVLMPDIFICLNRLQPICGHWRLLHVASLLCSVERCHNGRCSKHAVTSASIVGRVCVKKWSSVFTTFFLV